MSSRIQNGRKPAREREYGQAIIEVSLLAPWILFLFVGVLDFGFYSHALISTENAARVAALYAASNGSLSGDARGACQYVLQEMRSMPNVTSQTSCPSSCFGSCTAGPLTVTVRALDGAGGRPLGVDGGPATEVAVRYETVGLIPIPGIMAKQLSMTRVVQMRVIED